MSVHTNRQRVRVFVNPGATYGRGRERWRLVEAELRARVGEFEVEDLPEPDAPAPGAGRGRGSAGRLAERLAELVGAGERQFIAAGGDGTVNLLLNALMALPEGTEATLGAVGLGSSNDFHKPFDESAALAGMPARVDFERVVECDVIRIDYEAGARGGGGRRGGNAGRPDKERGADAGGQRQTRYSLVNASIGVTAEANARFNNPTPFVRAARRLSVDAAISAAVLSTLAGWRDITCGLALDGGEAEMVSVTNLGVFKNPHFGGTLCYDTPVAPDDGRLGVALCEGLTALETIATLSSLRRGRFRGRPKTRTWIARTVAVTADRVFALETDGEVVHARRAEFSVVPRRVRCCR